MPPAPADGVVQFKRAVQDLKNKSHSKITSLTSLADVLYEAAEEVSNVLLDEISTASASRLQPLISVVDSILKKVGKDYKMHFASRMPHAIGAVFARSDASMHGWLEKMLNMSWRKFDLLPPQTLDRLDQVFRSPAAEAAQAAQAEQAAQAAQAAPEVSSQSVVTESVALTAPASPPRAPENAPGPTPPMKAPPPQRAMGAGTGAQVVSGAAAQMTPELVERRLGILTKIIERRSPTADELHEIMKVPEIKKAIGMQQKGERQKAMAVLSQFKQELERKHSVSAPDLSRDPRRADGREAQRSDPRHRDPRPTDPRQEDPEATGPSDSRKRPAEAEATHKRPRAEAEPDTPGVADTSREASLATPAALGGAPAGPRAESECEAQRSLVPMLQGPPLLGFSEAWLRQFMEQMPSKAPQGAAFEAPSCGRKVLGARGEQMVYVDELSPNEMLLLLQLISLLEERLKRSGGVDLTRRIPHTFSYLQVDAAVDVMLKRLFVDLPFQCTTTGLRFSSQESLKKHHDATYRRKAEAQKRQRGAEARGWMESIPEWVGNRDLVVGPALFRLGEPGEEVRAEAPRPQAESSACPFDERRSVCPLSGELLERAWSAPCNAWAFADAVACEPASGSLGQSLSETALLFKRSCFSRSTASRHLQEALGERPCREPPAQTGEERGHPKAPAREAKRSAQELQELLALPARPAKTRSF